MSSQSLNERRNGKGGVEEWSPADTHVCSVFHDSGVYPVKNSQLLKNHNKEGNTHLFFRACAQEFLLLRRKTPKCNTGSVCTCGSVQGVCVCVCVSVCVSVCVC